MTIWLLSDLKANTLNLIFAYFSLVNSWKTQKYHLLTLLPAVPN